MFRKVLASAVAVGLLAGASVAAPSPVGLTPGAPLGSDSTSDEKIVVGGQR